MWTELPVEKFLIESRSIHLLGLRNSPTQQSTKLKPERLKRKLEQDKAQAEQDKAQTGQSSQDNIEIGVKKELAKEIKDIKCDSTVQVGKITSSLRGRLLQGRGSCKSTIQSAKAKCSRLANTTEERQLDDKIVRLNNSRGCTQAFSSSANMPVNASSGNS